MARKCPWGKEFADENGHCKFTEGEHMHAPVEKVIPVEVKQIDSSIQEEKKPVIEEKHIVKEKKKSFWRRILSS